MRILKGLLPIEAENRVPGRRPEQNPSIINGIEPQAYIADVIAKTRVVGQPRAGINSCRGNGN